MKARTNVTINWKGKKDKKRNSFNSRRDTKKNRKSHRSGQIRKRI